MAVYSFSVKPDTEDEDFMMWLKKKLHLEFKSFSDNVVKSLKKEYMDEFKASK